MSNEEKNPLLCHWADQMAEKQKAVAVIRKDFQSPCELRQILLNKDFPIPINEYKKAFKTQVLRGLA